jgi:hypothetical protein
VFGLNILLFWAGPAIVDPPIPFPHEALFFPTKADESAPMNYSHRNDCRRCIRHSIGPSPWNGKPEINDGKIHLFTLL